MENNYILGPDGELYHWGIKGMRWGHRRYQNKDGSLTEKGRKRYNEDMAKIKEETKKLKAKQRADAKVAKLEKAKKELDELKKAEKAKEDAKKRKAEQDAETPEERKTRILKSGTAEEVYSIKNDLSPQEMNNAKTRLQWESDMRQFISKETPPPAKSKTDRAMEKIDKFTVDSEKVIKLWNTGVNVANAFLPLDMRMLPKIDTNNKDGNREKRRGEQKALNNAKNNKNSSGTP